MLAVDDDSEGSDEQCIERLCLWFEFHSEREGRAGWRGSDPDGACCECLHEDWRLIGGEECCCWLARFDGGERERDSQRDLMVDPFFACCLCCC